MRAERYRCRTGAVHPTSGGLAVSLTGAGAFTEGMDAGVAVHTYNESGK